MPKQRKVTTIARYPKALTAKLQTVLAVMRDRKIDRVEVTYSGSGDSGGRDDINAYAADGSLIDTDQITVVLAQDLGEDKPSEVGTAFHDAIDSLFEDALAFHGYDGFENDAGGCGVFHIAVNGRVELEHNECVETYEESRYRCNVKMATAKPARRRRKARSRKAAA